jgi:hypothetical protein
VDDDVVGGQLALPMDTTRQGDLVVFRLLFGFLPPSKNVYDGWPYQWQNGVKKKWLRAVAAECEAQQLPRGVLRIGLAATLVFPTNNRRDPQNYSATLWNFVPDGLVRCGVLVDDRDGAVVFGPNLGVRLRAGSGRTGRVRVPGRTILSVSMVVPSR